MKTLILKVSIIAQGGLILCKYENAELQNLQGDYKDDGTRKSAYFLDGIRKSGTYFGGFRILEYLRTRKFYFDRYLTDILK